LIAFQIFCLIITQNQNRKSVQLISIAKVFILAIKNVDDSFNSCRPQPAQRYPVQGFTFLIIHCLNYLNQ